MRPDRMFWLDGGGARDWSGRRSLVGLLSEEDVSLTFDATTGTVLREQHGRTEVVGDDVFDVLAAELARDEGDPDVHWVGYFGYACRRDLPASPALPARGVPDAVWMRVRRPRFVAHAPLHPAAPAPLPDPPAVPASYSSAFDRVQEHLHAGNSYEVNLTYRRRTASAVDPETAYLRLRAANPAPYAGYLRHHGVHLLSSSPERFASVALTDDGGVDGGGRRLVARPIKGTTPRSAEPAEDARLREHLARDPKLRAENLMITDLLRHDLAQVCEVGSVEVPGLMEVESYATVHQLVTTVAGRLRPDVPTVAALRALFPAGSMTGAPKRRTMEVIEEVEVPDWGPRGVYAGAFGWICADGRADLGVVIRSLVAVPAGPGQWDYELGTGGGITVRSDVAEEWAETTWKADRLLAVLR